MQASPVNQRRMMKFEIVSRITHLLKSTGIRNMCVSIGLTKRPATADFHAGNAIMLIHDFVIRHGIGLDLRLHPRVEVGD